jgi:hypothetical protein
MNRSITKKTRAPASPKKILRKKLSAVFETGPGKKQLLFKQMETEFDNLQYEANKEYMLGMKSFLFKQQSKGHRRDVIVSVRKLLRQAHEKKMRQINRQISMEDKIEQCRKLVNKYKKNCYSTDHKIN